LISIPLPIIPLQSRKVPQEVTRTLIPTRVIIQILLMICLRIPPLARWQDLRNNLSLPPLLIDQLRYLPRHTLLLRVVIEDATAVLRASIWTLLVRCRRVVHLIEELEELAVCYLCWIVGDLKSFGMSRTPRTHSPITRTLHITANVPDSRIVQSLSLEFFPEHVLDAPETSCCDGG